MAEESLFTAARSAVRGYQIDMNKGGIIGIDTQRAMETLQKHAAAAGGYTEPEPTDADEAARKERLARYEAALGQGVPADGSRDGVPMVPA